MAAAAAATAAAAVSLPLANNNKLSGRKFTRVEAIAPTFIGVVTRIRFISPSILPLSSFQQKTAVFAGGGGRF
jgi:hypothetical protein